MIFLAADSCKRNGKAGNGGAAIAMEYDVNDEKKLVVKSEEKMKAMI